MTAPTGSADATVAAVQDQATPLGLAWQMKLGTVVDGANPASVPVQLDGDQAATVINASSLVGQLLPGERIYVQQVPPSGLYIVGTVRGNNRWLDGAAVDTAGSLGVTSAATELDIPNLALRVPAWRAGQVYIVQAQIFVSFSVPTDGFTFALRRDTALTGSTLAAITLSNRATLDTVWMSWPIRPTANEYGVPLFFSVVRISGTGTCTVNGSPGSSIARTWSGIKTAGAVVAYPGGVWRAT